MLVIILQNLLEHIPLDTKNRIAGQLALKTCFLKNRMIKTPQAVSSHFFKMKEIYLEIIYKLLSNEKTYFIAPEDFIEEISDIRTFYTTLNSYIIQILGPSIVSFYVEDKQKLLDKLDLIKKSS